MIKIVGIILAIVIFTASSLIAQDVSIDSAGNVSAGVTNPGGSGNLDVTGNSGEHAVRGITSGTGAAGVYGENTDPSGYGGYFKGNARVNGSLTVDGAITSGEQDPKVGTLTGGKLCTSNGTVINCTSDTPTETDPSVNALGKATLNCASGQAVKWNSAAWVCAPDIDTDTTYSAGSGLSLNGSTFSISSPLDVTGVSPTRGIIKGQNMDANGYGLEGVSFGTSGYGVRAQALGVNGTAIYGETLSSNPSSKAVWGYAPTGAVAGYFNALSGYGLIVENGNVGLGTTSPQSALQVSGYIQLDLTSGTPPDEDCNDATEYGRMKVDDANGLLYICVTSGWVYK